MSVISVVWRDCHQLIESYNEEQVRKTDHYKLSYLCLDQGCGNTIPNFSDKVPFHSGQVENFYLLVFGQVQCIKLIQFCISYFDKLLGAHILH